MKSSFSACSKKDISVLSAAIGGIIVGDLGNSIPVEKIKTEKLRKVAREINKVLSVMRKRITDERMAEGAEIFRRKKLQTEIKDFSAAIKAIARGDLARKAEIKKGGELKSLADSFNIMTLELKRLREEAARSRVRSLVESLSDGVVMFDFDRKATLINSAAKKIARETKSNQELFEFARLFSFGEKNILMDEKDFNKKIANIFRTGKIWNIGEANVKQSVFAVSAIPVYDYGKNVIGGALVMRDITHINQISKMKTEFISIVSHELRTPINEINWNIEMLLIDKENILNEKQRASLKEMYAGSKKMLQIINDLLNVSGLESGKITMKLWPVQIDDLVEAAIGDINSLAPAKKCKIIFSKPKKKLPKISLDPNLMRHAVFNLIDNAVAYSSLSSSPEVFVTLKKDGRAILFSVKDNGIGIPQSEKARVFDKFFRGENAKKIIPDGSGLGLYAINMIVELFGGKVWFESQKNRGTVFFIKIPFGA